MFIYTRTAHDPVFSASLFTGSVLYIKSSLNLLWVWVVCNVHFSIFQWELLINWLLNTSVKLYRLPAVEQINLIWKLRQPYILGHSFYSCNKNNCNYVVFLKYQFFYITVKYHNNTIPYFGYFLFSSNNHYFIVMLMVLAKYSIPKKQSKKTLSLLY